MGDDHQIRLRGGWECNWLDPPDLSTSRLTLPTNWPADGRRLRLTRRFRQPQVGPGARVILRLEHIPGTQSVELDGVTARAPAPGYSVYELPLDASLVRHGLVLIVDSHHSSDWSTERIGWGHVSLVIRSTEPGEPGEGSG